MIIHFIGGAGSGKSALAEAILSARDELRPRSDRDVVKLHSVAMMRLLLPRYMRMGRAIAAYNNAQGKVSPRLWAYKLSVEDARRQLGGNWIVHHGFTNTMRKKTSPIALELSSRLPFPDVIVNIGAIPAIRAARICIRNKAASKILPLNGSARHQAARLQARRWLQILPEEAVLDCLVAFNQRRCHPLLTEAELLALVAAEKDAPLSEADRRALTYTPLPESYTWLKQVFMAQGGTWIDFENSGASNLQQSAEDLLSRLPLL